MTETAAGKHSVATAPSEGKPEVIVNRDALIVGDTFYLIDEIKKVEVEHMPWQNWVGITALALAMLLYAFQSDLVMVLP